MGIKNLYKLIEKSYTPKPVTLASYSGKVIGVDISPILYATLLSGANLTFEGRPVSHINGLFYKCIDMIEAGITPLFVFDGRAGALKDKCLSDRKSTRKLHITAEMISECQQLLSLLGVRFIQAEGEADALLASLCKSGAVWAVATDDSDLLAFGAPRIWRMKSGLEYCLSDICAALKVTPKQFVEICVLLGGDYGNPFHGVGPVKALSIISQFGSIENYTPTTDWQPIYAEFTQECPAVVPAGTPLDREGCAKFLVEFFGHRPDRVATALSRI